MAKLIYSAIASADGYVEDAAGGFDWGAPDEELLRFVNDLERPVGTYLYGRRMYETMLYWETAHTVPGQPSLVREFTGIWQAAEKVVFSRTLDSVPSARTRIERNFDPGTIRQLKSATGHDAGHPPVRKRCRLPQIPSQASVLTSAVPEADRCARTGHPAVTQPDAWQTQLMLLPGARAEPAEFLPLTSSWREG